MIELNKENNYVERNKKKEKESLDYHEWELNKKQNIYQGKKSIFIIELKAAWEAGDFAFIRFPGIRGLREYHPFSIVNVPSRNARLRFAIRGDGDFTRALPEKLTEGAAVEVLPPFGRYQRFLDERDARLPRVRAGGSNDEFHARASLNRRKRCRRTSLRPSPPSRPSRSAARPR